MELSLASAAHCLSLAQLVNSAYRGASSTVGWTTEAHLIDGQRTDEQELRRWIAGPQQALLFLGPEDSPLACVKLHQCPGDRHKIHLGMLTVKPQLQGQGLGKDLLTGGELWAKKHWDAKTMEITVIQLRSELLSWYERRGYRCSGEKRPFPYGQVAFGLPKRNDLHFLVMEKKLY